MFDKREFRRRVLLRLASSPVTLVPFGIGVTVLAVGGIAIGSPLAAFVGVLGMLGGVGTFLSRFVLDADGRSRVAQDVLRELKLRGEETQERELDELANALAADKDPRDEQLLAALRDLAGSFQRDTEWTRRINAVSAADITRGVQELFASCVEKLRASLQLLKTMRALTVEDAREGVRLSRERLLGEVTQGVETLSTLLTDVYALGAGNSDTDRETRQIRQRLRDSLEIARRVQEQLNPEARRATLRVLNGGDK